ncbi:LysR substrate-binding domain-containing protein [Methylorubrum aminovorans]
MRQVYWQLSAKGSPESCLRGCLRRFSPSTWDFEKGGREIEVRGEGQLVFNTVALIHEATLAGFGIAHLPQDQVQAHLDRDNLVRMLADWCPSFSGNHLCYPSRSQLPAAFERVVEALRYRDWCRYRVGLAHAAERVLRRPKCLSRSATKASRRPADRRHGPVGGRKVEGVCRPTREEQSVLEQLGQVCARS